MGQSADHVLGRFQKYFAVAESTFGTYVKHSATNAVKLISHTFTPTYERIDRADVRQTRSLLERITGRESAQWSVEGYLLPSGSAGTAPDAGVFFETAMGTETVGGSDVTYSLSSEQALGSISLLAHDGLNDAYAEAVRGAWVDKLTINIAGGEPPRWSAEGGAVYLITTGSGTTVNGAHSSSDATIQLATDEAEEISVGSIVQFGSEDNSGAGYEVTAVDLSTDIITISPGLAGGLSGGEAVKPFAPSETTAGSPIAGTLGTFNVDSAAFPITAATIELSNEIIVVDNEAGQTGPTDYIPGPDRMVTGSLSIRVTANETIELGKRRTFVARDIDLTCGSTAGAKVQVRVQYAEFEFSNVEIPDAPEATITIPFRALGSSGEDELTVKFF